MWPSMAPKPASVSALGDGGCPGGAPVGGISLALGICEWGATDQIGNGGRQGLLGQTHKTSQPFQPPAAGWAFSARGGEGGVGSGVRHLVNGHHASWVRGEAPGRAALGAHLGEGWLMA